LLHRNGLSPVTL